MVGRSPPWARKLEVATERARLRVSAAARGGDRAKSLGRGASGDKTLLADRAAEDELTRALLGIDELRVLSEEAGEMGDPGAKLLAIVDPLDGSSNFERGIPFYCTSVAVAEGRTLGRIRFGIVRNLVNGDVYTAVRGAGAKKNGRIITTSRTESPAEAVAGVDLSRADPQLVAGIAPLLAGVRRHVHFGANALELCYLAEGAIDASVDLRGRMRITDFAAGYLIAKEAGAVITGPRGAALRPDFDLKGRFSYVAAANGSLHGEIVRLCGDAGS